MPDVSGTADSPALASGAPYCSQRGDRDTREQREHDDLENFIVRQSFKQETGNEMRDECPQGERLCSLPGGRVTFYGSRIEMLARPEHCSRQHSERE
jgi:hypothetical protein